MKWLALCVATVALCAPAAAQSPVVSGVVFLDRNGNGQRDAGDTGVAGAVVSNQDAVVRTGADGSYRLEGRGAGLVFVSIPTGHVASGAWFKPVTGASTTADFGLQRGGAGESFTFIHASDTHIAEASMARSVRLLALADSVRPAFVIITGDLVRDALRVSEAEATGYYELFASTMKPSPRPIWTVPGNHEVFGIERDKSGVSADHPLFGREMYRKYRGPDYYSFNAGGVHFIGLNTVDISDQWYYGHVDSVQLAWLARDVAAVPRGTPIVTFNHIPLYSALEAMGGYVDAPPAPSLITVGGKTNYRHVVSNARDVMAIMKGHEFPLALGGHVHMREELRYAATPTRFVQAAAVVGPNPTGGFAHPSGITVYRVTRGRISEGTFVPLGIP